MVQRHRIYFEDDARDGLYYGGAGSPQVQRKKWLDVTWDYTEQAPLGLLSGFEVVVLNGTDPDDPATYVRAPEIVASDVRRYTMAVAVGTELGDARAAVRAVYGAAKSAWTLQGVGQVLPADALALGTAQAVADAQSTAAGAQADAANALSDATANKAALDDIAADGKFTAAEKRWAVLEYGRMLTDQPGIEATATALGITTEKTDFTNAMAALGSYLQGLSPAWDDTSTTTAISRTVFKANWDAVYDARQVLLNKTAEVAALRADWAEVYGPGKPADGADVTDYGNPAINSGAEIPDGALLTSGNLEFYANRSAKSQNPNTALGEVGLTDGFVIDASGARQSKVAVTVNTPFEGAHTYRGLFYIVWSDEVTNSRFTADFGANNYFVATYDEAADQWTAWPNVGSSVTYTPLGTDLLLAVGTRVGDSPGITSVKSLLRPTGGLLYHLGGGDYVGALNASFNEDGGNLVQDPHFDAVVAGTGPAPFSIAPGVSYGNIGEGGSPALGITATATAGENIYSTLRKNDALVVYPARAGDAFIVRARVYKSGGHASDMHLMLDERDSATDYGNSTGGYPRFFEASGLVDGWNDVTGIAKVQQAATRGVVFAFYCDGGAKVAGDYLVIDFIQLTPLLAGWETLPESGATFGATAAQVADINAAQFELSNIGADGILHPTEKKDAQARYNELWGRRASVQYQADTFGLGALRSTYDAASSALDSYLTGLSPAWNDKSQSTSISRTVWDANWQAVLDAERDILDAISDLTRTGITTEDNLLRNPTGERGWSFWSRGHSSFSTFQGGSSDGYLFYYGGTYSSETYVNFSDPFPVGAGIPLTLSADLLTAGLSNGNSVVDFEFFDGGYNLISGSDRITLGPGQGWTRKAVTVTPPSGTVYARLRMFLEGATGTNAGCRRIMVNNGTRAAAYVDTLGSERDQRNLGQVIGSVQAGTAQNALSAADVGSFPRISIAAHVVQYGDFSVSYNSGSIDVSFFNTKYYVYVDDPDYKGGAVTYLTSTNPLDPIKKSGRRYLGTITTPSNGGGGSTGNPPGADCLVAGTWLRPGLLVDELQVGDVIDCWDEGAKALFPRAARYVQRVDGQLSVLLTAESGAQKAVSACTPITTEDGRSVRAADALGARVLVPHAGQPLGWEAITAVDDIGLQTVYHINVGGISLAGGVDPAHRIVTHNAYKP